jgi:hypothetical protein
MLLAHIIMVSADINMSSDNNIVLSANDSS